MRQKAFIGCTCGELYHSFLLTCAGDHHDVDDYFIDVHLLQYYGFFGRLVIAFKSVFGKVSDDGLFDVTTIHPDDSALLVEMLSHLTLEIDEKAIECAVFNSRYKLVFQYDPTSQNNDFCMAIEFNRRASFSGRVWQGIRYVCGYRSPYCGGDQFPMTKEAARALRGMAISHYSRKNINGDSNT